MKIEVTYEYPTAKGHTARHTCLCRSLKEAEDICKEVEKRSEKGYKLIDVTRDVYEDNE